MFLKKLGINTVLFTKDGRKIGNAIIIGMVDITKDMLYIIKTDYGHITNLNFEDLNEFFYFDFNVYTGEDWNLYKADQLQNPHKNSVKI